MSEDRPPSTTRTGALPQKLTQVESRREEDAAPGCKKHKNPSALTRCLYGKSGKKECDKCRIEDLERSVAETQKRLLTLQEQILT